MKEMGRMERESMEQGAMPAAAVWNPSLRAGDLAAFAAEVKRLTNYEVWRCVESALAVGAPNPEQETLEWLSLRILLDELKWRLSGLEGAKSNSGRMPVIFRPN